MNVAAQTIAWGQTPSEGIEEMLRQIKKAGYDGVEFWQHPNVAPSPRKLLTMLERLDLKLIGVSGGSLSEKIAFVRRIIECEQMAYVTAKKPRKWVAYAPRERKPYIYVDGWEGARSDTALEDAQGYVIALHPAMFKSVQTMRDAEVLLERHPKLRFIPDTGHLTVAGENILDVLKQTYDRLEAVHLKDWHAEYGRAMPFYSGGFTELGKGMVDLDSVLNYLLRRGYHGWLVVDQNFTANPAASFTQSREWLRKNYKI